MGYLEKLFLGTMVMFLSIVLFFFGMYFDLYEMLLGTSKQTDPLLSVGEFAYTRAAMERVARPIEIMPHSASNSEFGLPGSATELARLYTFTPPKMTPQETIGWWRERLKAKGLEGELLDMEALGHDREAHGELMVRVGALNRAKDHETAAAAIEEALRSLDARNLLVMRDLLLALAEAYNLAGKKEELERTSARLAEVAERVLAIRARAPGGREYSAAAAEAAREKDSPSKPPPLDDAARADMKARLLKAREEGKITAEEMEQMLEQLK
ncbi:MAG: hypothetical protein HYY25_10740 [Candidatus Wallbacteria bacterium]|nr:hypothetical protein [Candidatus Wallbacteria bacterium]